MFAVGVFNSFPEVRDKARGEGQGDTLVTACWDCVNF